MGDNKRHRAAYTAGGTVMDSTAMKAFQLPDGELVKGPLGARWLLFGPKTNLRRRLLLVDWLDECV